MHDDGEPRQGHKLSPWPLMSPPAGRAGHPGGVRARCSQQARRGALTGTGGRSPRSPSHCGRTRGVGERRGGSSHGRRMWSYMAVTLNAIWEWPKCYLWLEHAWKGWGTYQKMPSEGRGSVDEGLRRLVGQDTSLLRSHALPGHLPSAASLGVLSPGTRERERKTVRVLPLRRRPRLSGSVGLPVRAVCSRRWPWPALLAGISPGSSANSAAVSPKESSSPA